MGLKIVESSKILKGHETVGGSKIFGGIVRGWPEFRNAFSRQGFTMDFQYTCLNMNISVLGPVLGFQTQS